MKITVFVEILIILQKTCCHNTTNRHYIFHDNAFLKILPIRYINQMFENITIPGIGIMLIDRNT